MGRRIEAPDGLYPRIDCGLGRNPGAFVSSPQHTTFPLPQGQKARARAAWGLARRLLALWGSVLLCGVACACPNPFPLVGMWAMGVSVVARSSEGMRGSVGIERGSWSMEGLSSPPVVWPTRPLPHPKALPERGRRDEKRKPHPQGQFNIVVAPCDSRKHRSQGEDWGGDI